MSVPPPADRPARSAPRARIHGLGAYAPRLAADWGDARRRTIDGTLASVDLSGFTPLTERLSTRGRAGAEELTLIVNRAFDALLRLAEAEGGDTISFGGDALLVLFSGPDHERRACRALAAMQTWIESEGAISSSRGPVRLRMSVGAHSATFDVVAIGERQRALAVVGEAASRVVALEAAARPGQILISERTAAALPAGWSRRIAAPYARALRRARVPEVTQARSAPRPRGDARWMPPAVARLLRQTPDAAELRWACVAFLLVGGVEAVLARSAEEAFDALRAVGAVVEATCEEFGLTWLSADIARDGVKMIVTAGVPESREGDEERLLRGLRRIVEGCAGLPLVVRAGATVGGMYAGDVGHPARRGYTVMGDAVNLAARLAGAADPGEALVVPALVGASTRGFRVVAVPPLVLKGKREPVVALRLGEPLAVRRAALDHDLVGRDAERDALGTALRDGEPGHGACLEVVGPAGMGKTHLVSSTLATARGVPAGWGGGDPYAAAVPHSAIAPALRALLAVPADADARGAARALAARVEALAPALSPWLPLVAAAIGAAAPETPATRRLDPAFRGQRLNEVVVELLVALGRPVVVVVDDVQWADDASRGLLVALGRAAREAGWVVMALRRPEGRGLEGLVDDLAVIRLTPLADDAARRLVVAAAGEGGLPDDALDAIVGRAGGHPFFLLQLARAFASGQTDLPPDVERMSVARIDRLDPRDRLLVRQTSVAGRDVDLDVLARALDDASVTEPSRWRALHEMVEVEGGRARFRHDLFREAAYDGLPVARRTAVHRALGMALMAAPSESEHGLSQVLATHFSRGDRPREAWRFARRAASEARAGASWAEAARMCEVAGNAGTRVLGPDAPAVMRVRLRQAEALENLGRLPEALDCLARRSSASPPRGPEAELLRARLLHRSGRMSAALRATTRVLDMVGDDAALATLRAEALFRRGGILQQVGRSREALRLARAARAAATSAAQRGRASLLIALSGAAIGDPEAPAAEREALRLLRGPRHRADYGNCLTTLGADAFFLGRWQEALALWSRATVAFRDAGDSTGLAMVANNLAETYFLQGRPDDALEQLAHARRVFAAAGDRWAVALNDSLHGTIAAWSGDLDEADRRLSDATGVLADLRDREYLLDGRLRLVEVMLWRGAAEGALRRARELDRHARRLGVGGVGGMAGRWARRLEAWALVQLGRLDEARSRVDRLAAAAKAMDAPTERLLCLLTWEEIDARVGVATDPGLLAERDELVGALGVVALPTLPLTPAGSPSAPSLRSRARPA